MKSLVKLNVLIVTKTERADKEVEWPPWFRASTARSLLDLAGTLAA